MTNDKLKEAIGQAFELEKEKAYKCCESCGIKFSNAGTYFHYGFLAGAAYIRETEIKALLEIVKMQKDALEYRRWHDDDCADLKENFNSYEVCECGASAAKQAITATDEKLKSMGMEI